MLGPISLNTLNKNMNDVTENTFSRFEDDTKLKVRVDMPNNRPSVQ